MTDYIVLDTRETHENQDAKGKLADKKNTVWHSLYTQLFFASLFMRCLLCCFYEGSEDHTPKQILETLKAMWHIL